MIQQSHFWIYILGKWNQHLKEISAPHVHGSFIYNNKDMEGLPWWLKVVKENDQEFFVQWNYPLRMKVK